MLVASVLAGLAWHAVLVADPDGHAVRLVQ
jgi:hypothetical protein